MKQDENENLILGLFGKEKLIQIQKRFAKATGLAVVTINYQGSPVIPMAGCTDFCRVMQKKYASLQVCESASAYGGIKSALTGKSTIYRCPCGLIEIAMPIILDGQYLGAFICGQARCNDLPADFDPIVRCCALDVQNLEPEEQNCLEQMKFMPYGQLLCIAALVQTLVDALCDDQKQFREEEHQRIEAETIVEKQYRQIEALQENAPPGETSLEDALNMHFLFNSLTTAANLSILEGAVKTNEMVTLLSEYLRKSLTQKGFWTLEEEIHHVEQYLQIQKIRFGDRISYQIDIARHSLSKKVPVMLLTPFIEYAVSTGITSQVEGGRISVNGILKDDHLILTILDDGKRDAPEENRVQLDVHKNAGSLKAHKDSMKKKLVKLYGTGYHIVEDQVGDKNRCVIRIPAEKANHV